MNSDGFLKKDLRKYTNKNGFFKKQVKLFKLFNSYNTPV